MTLSPIQWIVAIITLLIGELFLWGAISGQKEVIGLAFINIFFLFLFLLKPLVKWCIQQRYVSMHTVNQRASQRQKILSQYGATIVTIRTLWEGLHFLLSASWQLFLLSLFIYCGILWQIRNDIAYHGFRWGKKRMGREQWGLVVSILISISLLGQHRDANHQKYFWSFGAGLVFYSIVLAFCRYGVKQFMRHVPRILFSGITIVTGFWVSAVSIMQRYDDHTIEKIIYQEKEKIIYISSPRNEPEVNPKEVVHQRIVGENILEEKIMPTIIESDKENEILCEEGTCAREKECITLPEHALCQTGTGNSPWVCDKDFFEQNGICLPLTCPEGQCLLPEGGCVQLPINAFCDDENPMGWVCDKRFYPVNSICYNRTNLVISSESDEVINVNDTLNVLEKYQQKQNN